MSSVDSKYETKYLRDHFTIRHAIGEPCGEWMGGVYICGCADPKVGPRAFCINCHHSVKAVPKDARSGR